MSTPTTEALASPRPVRKDRSAFGLIRAGLGELLGRRRLTRYLVGSDIKRAHADTLFGQLWWVIDPLLQMAVYIILVTIIFQRPTPDYPLFIFAAILPWKWFTSSVGDGISAVSSQDRLIKQVHFPKIVLPTAAVVAEFVASDNGLGFLLLEYNGALDTSMTFATIIVLSALGLALYGIVELIEHFAIPWHISRRREPAPASAIQGVNP